MHRYTLSCSAEAADLEPVVLAVHELVHRLPVTAKSRDKDGIRVEEGRIIDRHYNGPVLLEQVCGKDPCPLPEEQIDSKR